MASAAEVQKRSLEKAEKRGEYWTQKELDTLFKDFEGGSSLEEIAAKLARSYYAVSTMHSLGKLAASEFVEKARARKQTRVLPYDVPRSFWTADEW